MNLTWIVERRVAAMARPWPEDVESLRRLGFGGVLSLTEHAPEGFARAALAHRHVPVRDFAPPTPEQIAEAVSFMDEVLARGAPVAVHCGAGLGRTGTVVAAWLVRHGASADDAIRDVRRLRPGSVETPEQEDAVRRYERSISRRS